MGKNSKRKETLAPGEIIPIIYDYVFTGIFNDPKNIDILESFISDVLNVPIEWIEGKCELQPRELEIQNKKNKNAQIDLLVDIEGSKINIELQKQKSKGIGERNTVYHSTIHGTQMKYGDDDYSNIHYTVQIRLNNYRTNEKEVVESSCMRTDYGRIVEKKFLIYEVDIEFGKEVWYTSKRERVPRWCKIITATTMKELKEVIGEGFLGKEKDDKLIEEVNRYSTDNQVIALYMKLPREELEKNTLIKEAKEDGYNSGKEEGYHAGEMKKQYEIAQKMLEKNMDINMIIDITGLQEKEIKNLKKKQLV